MKILNDTQQHEQVLSLFDNYIEKDLNKLSRAIIIEALKACSRIGDLQRGLTIHQLVSSRLASDPYVLSCLIHLYMQCGDIKRSQSLFNTSTKKTLSIYEVMMKGYIKNNFVTNAIDLFKQINSPNEIIVNLLCIACSKSGTSEALDVLKHVSSTIPTSFYKDSRLVTSLFNAYINCGDCSSAEAVFAKMKRSVVSYANLINGFNKDYKFGETLRLFDQMKNDSIEGDVFVYLGVIKALAQIGAIALSERIMERIPDSFLLNQRIQIACIDMWGRIGSVNQAKQIFEQIVQPDQMGYNAMINAYGYNGMGLQAVELFHQVPFDHIDEITSISILTICAHSRLVDKARSIFNDTEIKTDKIYTSMIDCLSRASFYQEAEELMDEFERHHAPLESMYMTFLFNAQNERNHHVSQHIMNRMKKLFPHSTPPSVGPAYMDSSSDNKKKAFDMIMELNRLGVKRKVAKSITAVNGQMFEFQAHDRSHPRSSEIYVELDRLAKEISERGYTCDSRWITRPLRKNETVSSVLFGHSERLAIAWNFVENPKASFIQIKTNIRICEDCHHAIKLIAQVRQCEIVARDVNRIHHFYTTGECSCKDHF